MQHSLEGRGNCQTVIAKQFRASLRDSQCWVEFREYHYTLTNQVEGNTVEEEQAEFNNQDERVIKAADQFHVPILVPMAVSLPRSLQSSATVLLTTTHPSYIVSASD